MRKPTKLNGSKLLFCSDLHLGHVPKTWTPLYVGRGFNSIEEHDEWFFSEWNRLVDLETVVINLGDATFNDADIKKFSRLARLPCEKHIYINGNHYSGAKQAFESVVGTISEVYPTTYENLTFAGQSQHFYVDGVSVYCQHYAQFIWPEQGDGGFCLCGHSHGNAAPLNVGNDSIGKILDVGVDNAIKYNNTPFFTWAEVKTILAQKNIVKNDHH